MVTIFVSPNLPRNKENMTCVCSFILSTYNRKQIPVLFSNMVEIGRLVLTKLKQTQQNNANIFMGWRDASGGCKTMHG